MLSLLFNPPRRTFDPWVPVSGPNWYGGRSRTRAAVVVDEQLALTCSAIWCATRFICETIGGLPLTLDLRDPGHKGMEVPHRLNALIGLNGNPNPEGGATAFRVGRHVHQLNWGNAFAEIERETFNDPRAPVVALWPIHPSRVLPEIDSRKIKEGYHYQVRNNDGSAVLMKPHELLHIPGALAEDGRWGKGVLTYARETAGIALSQDRHQATQLGEGNMPKVVAFVPGLKDREARNSYRQEWREVHGHPDSADIALLPAGKDVRLERLNFSNVDTQFLAGRVFTIQEVARWYTLPPHVLAELSRGNHANIDRMAVDLVVHSLMPWAVNVEEEMALKLLTPEERKIYHFRHHWISLLKGDFASRMKAYEVGLRCGVLTHNLINRLEGWPEIGPAGDQHFVPVNWTTVERMYENPPDIAKQNKANPLATKRKQQPQEEEEPTEDKARAAAGSVLADTLSRMFTKESKAALRAANGSDFEGWLGDFYGKHQEILMAALQPACQVACALGIPLDAQAVAIQLSVESRSLLEHAYNHDTPEQFTARLATWPTERARATARNLLGRVDSCSTAP